MSRSSYTDPVENMRCYIMVHGGVDRQERLLDVDWIADVVKAAREVSNSFSSDEMDTSVAKLKEALRS